MQACPACGAEVGNFSLAAGGIDVVEHGSVVEESPMGAVRTVKKKRRMALLLLLLLAIGAVAFSFYRQYRKNAKELQAYVEQGFVEEAREKAENMPKWQAKKAFDQINHKLQSENDAYKKKKAYDAGFYQALEEKALTLHELERLDEATRKSMPDLQYCYQEALQKDALSVAEEYLSFLEGLQMEQDAAVQEKLRHAKEVRSSYEAASLAYESGDYQEALDICKAIAPDELDAIYIDRTAALLKEIQEEYAKAVEENMQSAVENQDYATIFEYIKALKDGSAEGGTYQEMESEYLDGAIKAVKSFLSYQELARAYATCKAVAECLPDNGDVAALFVQTAQKYVKDLLLSSDEEIEFALYPVDKMEIPYLLALSGGSYQFYKYNENHRSAELAAEGEFDTYLPAEGLFFRFETSMDSGYFSTTAFEGWDGYSFDGKEFVFESRLEKIQERHFEAFTNKVLSSEETYKKDNEVISESEYDAQRKSIESAEGITAYSYSEENINAVLYPNSAK